jgi:predicted acyl esterase
VTLRSSCYVPLNLMRAGHRLHVHVTSSDFPRFDRNANSGAPIGTDTELHVAEHTVFHDAAHPSRIELSVIHR